jgi:two-component system NarL family response regulator
MSQTTINLMQSASQEETNSTSPVAPHDRIRLLIVDDHPIVRFGLATLLGMQDDFDIVATVGTGHEAIAVLKTKPIDVILVDLRMPGLSGVQTLQSIGQMAPEVRSIVLSSFEFDEEIYAAVRAGAQGYLHKEAPAEDIMRAIRLVSSGKQAFPRRIADRLSNKQMTAGLSAREREILELVAKGLTNKEVAASLHISQFTVRTHLTHITSKLEVSHRTEAIAVASQTGLITL